MKNRSTVRATGNLTATLKISVFAAGLLAVASAIPAGAQGYFPPPGEAWEHRSASDLGMDSLVLQRAVDYALQHEVDMPRDLGAYLRNRFEGRPFQDIVGPTRVRARVNGIITRHGYIVAEWGDTRRADMSFSATKSYLSTVAGLAFDRGLIDDLDGKVSHFVQDGTFDSEHNGAITWRNLLQQTSEWEGTLWEKPDRADRRRGVDRVLQQPGTFWEYNDVRVNVLAYSLLQVWRRALPTVLRDEIMDPIGASTTWRWNGYDNSWTVVDGVRVQSVSGGGHWGGGLLASTRDHARFGYLMLRGGRWGDRRIISQGWITAATTPLDLQPTYGFMWWLNTGRQQYSAAPASSFFAIGGGSTNVIWIDPEHDLVAVFRWLDGSEHVNEVMRLVLESMRDEDG